MAPSDPRYRSINWPPQSNIVVQHNSLYFTIILQCAKNIVFNLRMHYTVALILNYSGLLVVVSRPTVPAKVLVWASIPADKILVLIGLETYMYTVLAKVLVLVSRPGDRGLDSRDQVAEVLLMALSFFKGLYNKSADNYQNIKILSI